MKDIVFRRKIYDEILEWKEKYSHKYALLIKGAKRVGKSTQKISRKCNASKSDADI